MFENIIGHDKEKEVLRNILKNNNISHAYLFSGKKGIGKATIALEFARNILKVDNLETSPDFKYICKMADKKDIVIEQIRKELIDDIYIAPAVGDKKVYVIDDAQSLNTASQNALLKTLEEPPKYVVVILVSSNISAFLPTIISRVNILNFGEIETSLVSTYIKNKYNVVLNENILEYLEGSIGSAIQIIQNELLDKFLNVEKLFDFVQSKDVIQSLNYSQQIDFSNEHMLDYLQYILYKNGCYASTKYIDKAKLRLKYNGNYDIVMDSMILRILDSI